MTREQMIEAMARVISGAPFPSVRSRSKATVALDRIAPALIEQGRQMERADVVASLRESAAWHNKADDGLSGYAAISNALIEHADAIQRGEHVGGGDVADERQP